MAYAPSGPATTVGRIGRWVRPPTDMRLRSQTYDELAAGREVLIATTLPDNRGARALTGRLGLRPRSAAGSELELALELM